jgi:putative phage-type endonuclease
MEAIASQLLAKEQNGEFIEQLTDEWYNIRRTMFTASEIASVLECNIYQTKYDVLMKKLLPIEHISNEATEWGRMFESVAVEFYEFIQKEKVYSIGLVTHPKHKWIGASPDGLLLSGKLLEIKCPIRRNIGGEIPLYYWIQMQIQMEVCDMNTCDYFECKFHRYNTEEEYNDDVESANIQNFITYNDKKIYYKLLNTSLKTVNRDKKWFSNSFIKLSNVYDKLLHYQNLENGISQLKTDSKKNQKRKRSYSAFHHIQKKHKIDIGVIKWKNWVSATKIRNYMIDDPIIDWLDLYLGNTKLQGKVITNNTFQHCIMKQGLVFEQKIINMIRNKFPGKVVSVADYQEAKSYDRHLETVKHIKAGVPIIYQGVLHDYKRKIFGIPDLLVRHDYLNKLFNEPVTRSVKKNQYRVVDIKFISLELYADGKHLRHSNRNIYAYKGQLYIYNKILGAIQSHTPAKSYILGKTWSYTQAQNTTRGGPLERPAHINFKKNDKDIRTKTARAVKWIRDVTSYGKDWELYSRDELKPNMCNMDRKYHNIKKEIAEKHNDITMLWMCGVKHRNIAKSNGVVNWKTTPNLFPKKLGITGDKVASTLLSFIEMNQDTNITEPFMPRDELKTEWLIQPLKIKNNMFNWQEFKGTELFIDFETITPEVYPNLNIQSAFIFMIGVGFIVNGKWQFKCFKANGITHNDEREMLLEFHNYVNMFRGLRNIYHWGNAEQHLYRNAMNRHCDIIDKVNYITDWNDLLKLFKVEPIVARGMLNFSLKSVVKAFYDNCFIETNYDDNDVANGLDAMVMALECYKSNNVNGSVMTNIQTYNEVDCKVMWEILDYLRKNHIS